MMMYVIQSADGSTLACKTTDASDLSRVLVRHEDIVYEFIAYKTYNQAQRMCNTILAACNYDVDLTIVAYDDAMDNGGLDLSEVLLSMKG